MPASMNMTEKLVSSHLVEGRMLEGDESALHVDRVMPFWSNIPALGQYVYEQLDPGYAQRAAASLATGGHVIVGGLNYGQGSSRENAALASRPTRGYREIFRPHPLAKPGELRRAAADLCRPGRLSGDRARRYGSDCQPEGVAARRAGGDSYGR